MIPHQALGLVSDAREGNNGAFLVVGPVDIQLLCIASDGRYWKEGGMPGPVWEHVSCSTPKRAPNWAEMCFVKDLFWDEDDCVVQYHPPKADYVNCHPYCLHLWRPEGVELPRPPWQAVGPKATG